MTTLLLLPGWAYPGASLRPLADALAPRMVAEIHSPASCREQLVSSTGPVWLGGWSLGAMHAVSIADEFPDKVAGLLLIGFTARFCAESPTWPGTPVATVRGMARELMVQRERVLRNFFVGSAAPQTLPPEGLDQRVEDTSMMSTETLSEGLHALRTVDLRPVLPTITCPVRLFAAAEDRIVPVAATLASAALFPGARLKVHEGQGHELPLHDPGWIGRHFREG
ncbi:MAG TPA: alpha/beta fold hydrolase [Kiritimatiellia bacterium]|nr:alpha/beta fold hydrolase [Kiritimatiellia bacterium]